MTSDAILSRVDTHDPADLLPASDLAEELGHWEWAAWMRLRAAAPGRPVKASGEDVAFAATLGNGDRPWIESFPDHAGPVYRWQGRWAGQWVCLDPWDPDAAGPVEVPPDVRRALEAAAAEAVRRVVG